jgi:hypothetical protein
MIDGRIEDWMKYILGERWCRALIRGGNEKGEGKGIWTGLGCVSRLERSSVELGKFSVLVVS